MSFDAGTISGKLDLNTVGFEHGFSEAHTHAETESGKIREHLEALTEVLSEALGPAVGAVANAFKGMAAGFSEGPIVGSLNVIGTVLGSVRESVLDVGKGFHDLGLAAEKAGVNVEFMDRFANVAKVANVSLDQVGLGFKVLEQRAEEAAGGGKQAQAAFEHIGVSSTELATLLKDPEKLFTRVQEAIGGMTSAADRNRTAQQLLGRQGTSLIPIFAMSKETFDQTADSMDKLSGGVNEGSVKMGAAIGKLQAYFGAAMEGIQRAVAVPILTYLDAHMAEIEPKIQATVDLLVGAIKGAWDVISETWDLVAPIIKQFARLGEAELGSMVSVIKLVVKSVQTLESVFGDLGGAIGTGIAPLKDSVDVFIEIAKSVKWACDEISKFLDLLKQATGVGAVEGPTTKTAGMTADQAKAELGSKAENKTTGMTPDQVRAALGASIEPHKSDHKKSEAVDDPSEDVIENRAIPGKGRKAKAANRGVEDQGLSVPGETESAAGGATAPPGKSSAAAAPAGNDYYKRMDAFRDDLESRESKQLKSDSDAKMNEFARTNANTREILANAFRDNAPAQTQPDNHRSGGPAAGRQSTASSAGAYSPGRGTEGGGGSGGTDSLRSSFAQLSHSVDALSSQFRGGGLNRAGGGAAAKAQPTTQNFIVNLTTMIDGGDTAKKMSDKIIPILQKVMKTHEQKTEGALMASVIQAGMGGGGA